MKSISSSTSLSDLCQTSSALTTWWKICLKIVAAAIKRKQKAVLGMQQNQDQTWESGSMRPRALIPQLNSEALTPLKRLNSIYLIESGFHLKSPYVKGFNWQCIWSTGGVELSAEICGLWPFLLSVLCDLLLQWEAFTLWSRQKPKLRQMNGVRTISWLAPILSRMWRLRWNSVSLQTLQLRRQWTPWKAKGVR